MNNLQLKKPQQNKWYKNVLIFAAPVGGIYLLALVGIITANNGTVALQDFIPNSFTLGAIVLYVANTVLDYIRKLSK